MAVLTPQQTDFPRWYQEVIAKAELAESGPVRGTMVIRPWGFAIWELLQAEIDTRIKAAGAENVYFPLLIPESHLHREAEHVEGFSPELAVVTEAGGRRWRSPSSSARPARRSSASTWPAGSRATAIFRCASTNGPTPCAGSSGRGCSCARQSSCGRRGTPRTGLEADAAAYARQIHADVYRSVLQDVLAIPVIAGRKTEAERFAGATTTLTLEGMMRDGKALQLATSHELGQNFARAFGISYTDEDGASQFCWTTSWGSTTRMVGGMIMVHGDDAGLRLPPAVAPVQVVVVAVKDDPEVADVCDRLERELAATGLRARVDRQTDVGLGRRLTDWELKGVPVRLEVGPRDLAEGTVSLARRDRDGREAVAIDAAVAAAAAALGGVHDSLLDEAVEALSSRTVDVADLDEAIEAGREGFARLPWSECGPEGERVLNASSISVRSLTLPDGSIPASADDDDVMAIVARAY